MRGIPEDRAILLGRYILESGATVRQAAGVFGFSKSLVHKDVTERLARISPELYRGVKAVLEKNREERHIRGGLATKEKYDRLREL
ncbi:MAG: sporulation transcriptional regulator SpoIIID [Clostridiales bacterium]|nr:sporulation transcriptional regulator SpoIIID [Clostridiales bacterium]